MVALRRTLWAAALGAGVALAGWGLGGKGVAAPCAPERSAGLQPPDDRDEQAQLMAPLLVIQGGRDTGSPASGCPRHRPQFT